MKTSQECSSQSLAFKCIEFCSTLSNQGLRYAFSLKIGNFNFSLKSDNNNKKRSRPPSYIRRQKLRRELQKKNPAQGMAKETKAELLKKNVEPDTSKENMTSVNNTVEQDTHITRTPKIKPTPYVLDERMETETELPKKNSTEDKDTQIEEDTHTPIPKAPVKPTPSEPERDPNELTITIRKGKDATDSPAAGTRTYNLLSDPMRVSRVIDHFNLMDKAIRITKPTLSIPTLQVRLQETFAKLMADGLINTNPVKIQKASKGKIELWAHLPTESDH